MRFWFESRALPVPKVDNWSRRLEERVVLLFEQNELEIQEIAERVHIGRTKVMDIVRDAYRRIGKEMPDGRTRRSHLTDRQSSVSPFPT